tara:strand:+ start:6069 stop:7514 length:1446 start_codon:yes stop_codon:yes gene_type:complete
MLAAGDVSRIKTIGGWKPFSGSGEQLLLKVTAGPRKTASGVMALANYVARANEETHLDLVDEMGESVPFHRLKPTIKSWSLLADQDNLRPEARQLVSQGKPVAELPERERFWRNQAYHLVWSQTTEGTGLSEAELQARMREASREFVFREFAERDYQVLWGVHMDHPGRPHIHFIVKARSSSSRQLRLTPDLLEDLRAKLAQVARAIDLPVHSQRREDRPDLLKDILQGEAPLRQHIPRVAYDKDTFLAKQVPLWLEEEGPAWLARRGQLQEVRALAMEKPKTERAAFINSLRPQPVEVLPNRDLPEAFHGLLRQFGKVYSDPHGAMGSFFKMVNGDGRGQNHGALARWYLKRQPSAFGTLVQGAEKHLGDAAREAKSCRHSPAINWHKLPESLESLSDAFAKDSRKNRLVRDRYLILVGLGRLRRRMRQENILGPNLEPVRQRMKEIREFVPAPQSEQKSQKPALQRVVNFFKPSRKPTR